MKEFAVIGLGNFGATVVRKLAEYKCRVTAIDTDKTRIQAIQDQPITAVLADATDRKFLENLEVERFDSVVVSTGEDTHASILVTLHLKELGAKRIIVKARSEDHAKILRKVGATEAIIPEQQMAIGLSRSLAKANLIDYLPLATGYYVAELPAPEKFVDKTLQELKLRKKFNIQAIAMKDSSTGEFNFAPGGDYRVKSTDVLVVLGKEKDIEKAQR
jgi:trk system potassium uptake protein TrkA